MITTRQILDLVAEVSTGAVQGLKRKLMYYLMVNGVVFVCAFVGGTWVVYKGGKSLYTKSALANKRRSKAKQCKEAIEKMAEESNIPCVSDLESRQAILALSMTELLTELRSGNITAVAALQAYQYAALQSHKESNCLIEPITEAMAMAVALDEKTIASARGPLHGLPVSIKDNFLIKGYESTLGCAQRIGLVADEDAVLVQILKEAGAVPFVRTNVPQTLLSQDTSNPIFGVTNLPFFPDRSAGGSSGGEGALVGSGGSLLGMGNDIGGSIRIPAHFCGASSLKPGSNRLSRRGCVGCCRGQTAVSVSMGPLARDVDGVVLAMKVLLQADTTKLDPRTPHIPFKEQMYSSTEKLRLGVYLEPGIVATSEPCIRAVQEATRLLKDMGYEIIDLNVKDDFFKSLELYARSVMGDGARSFFNATKNDAVDASMKPTLMWASVPTIMKKTLASLFRFRNMWPASASFLDGIGGVSCVYDWWQHCADIEEFRYSVFDKWRKLGLDGIIAPFSVPSMKIGQIMKATGVVNHVSFYNTLDMPVGTVPVTTVTQEDEEISKNYPVSDPWHYYIKKSLCDMVGLPVSVQIVSFPYQEEVCLRIMKDLETALQDRA